MTVRKPLSILIAVALLIGVAAFPSWGATASAAPILIKAVVGDVVPLTLSATLDASDTLTWSVSGGDPLLTVSKDAKNPRSKASVRILKTGMQTVTATNGDASVVEQWTFDIQDAPARIIILKDDVAQGTIELPNDDDVFQLQADVLPSGVNPKDYDPADLVIDQDVTWTLVKPSDLVAIDGTGIVTVTKDSSEKPVNVLLKATSVRKPAISAICTLVIRPVPRRVEIKNVKDGSNIYMKPDSSQTFQLKFEPVDAYKTVLWESDSAMIEVINGKVTTVPGSADSRAEISVTPYGLPPLKFNVFVGEFTKLPSIMLDGQKVGALNMVTDARMSALSKLIISARSAQTTALLAQAAANRTDSSAVRNELSNLRLNASNAINKALLIQREPLINDFWDNIADVNDAIRELKFELAKRDSTQPALLARITDLLAVENTLIAEAETALTAREGEAASKIEKYSKTLTAVFTADNSFTGMYRWESSNNMVAEVDAVTGKITPVGAGTARINFYQHDTIKGKVNVTVKNEPTSITRATKYQGVIVLPATKPGKRPATTVIAVKCEPKGCNSTVTWSSSDPSIATIDPRTGKVTVVGKGTVTMTGQTLGEIKIEVQIDVLDVIPATVKLDIPAAKVRLSDGALQLSAIVKDNAANVIAGFDKLTWTSKDEELATVDSTGNVTLKAPGIAVIYCEARGVERRASSTITILP